MILIPAGDFIMGGTANRDEKPQRLVYLDSYMMGRTPVTVREFKAFCIQTGFDFSIVEMPSWGWMDDHPIVNVNWYEARAFCKWAGGDLPTEAQWEKAARGTDGREYPWGDDFDPEFLQCSTAQSGVSNSTERVGNFSSGASPYGCLDMAGNVREWCLDRYSERYSARAKRNSTGPRSGPDRIMRGGSWDLTRSELFRCANRFNNFPEYCQDTDGFRLACRLNAIVPKG